MKVGNEMLRVDNTNFTYNQVTGPENEAKKRILAQTISSKQRKSEAGQMPLISRKLTSDMTLVTRSNSSSVALPAMPKKSMVSS